MLRRFREGIAQPTTSEIPLECARHEYEYYKNLQAHDGYRPGEYGGPILLVPGLANEGGGWGTYVSFHLSAYLITQNAGLVTEGPAAAFGTSLNYCAPSA